MILYPSTPYKQLDAGLTYSSKKWLQYAVILLGFDSISLKFSQLENLPFLSSFLTISIALIIAFFSNDFFNMDTKLATLIGVGSSICDGSAIAATAPVIHAKEREVAQAISVIFSSMFGSSYLPTPRYLAPSLQRRFCLFMGTTVNDTSSVTVSQLVAWDSP